ncbi:MAG: M28 family metallopeptidase [Gammaproteobacteria bacterium]|nr:M28 family metallopeptidase [Gammaproteobacteria bacterium]
MIKSSLIILLSVFLIACGRPDDAPQDSAAKSQDDAAVSDAAITEADLARMISTLSSDEFEGRAPATKGGHKTKEYIAAEMQRIGLTPGNGGSYFQDVPLLEITLDPEQSYFSIGKAGEETTLSYREDTVYWTKRVVQDVAFENSDVVFVGYGVVAPEYGWNDYEGIDVRGKTVVMLINDPGFRTEDPDLFNGRAMTYYGRWTYKYEEAARQGAAAAVIIHDTAPAAYGWGVVEGSWSGPQLDLERPDGGAGRVAAEAWITLDVANKLFTDAGLDLAALSQSALSADFTAVPLEGFTASASLTNNIRRSESANVAGVLPGAKRPDEYVLYMAHWDHLGINATEPGEDGIFNGAVDNATGVAGILEIAEAFAAQTTPPERSVMFLAVTAEESGLLGSAYFSEAPLVPFKNIVGGINIDAVLPTGPTRDLIVVGSGASELEDILETVAKKYDRYLRPDAEPEKGFFYRSDHISLAKKGVPMLYSDAGIDLVNGGEEAGRAASGDYTQNRYHKPADEYSDDWDLSGMTAIFTIFFEVGETLAYSDRWPNWYEGNEFRALRDAQRGE